MSFKRRVNELKGKIYQEWEDPNSYFEIKNADYI
jgi:hypothetical protein